MKELFDFGKALELLKQGKKLQREGWNGNKRPPIIDNPPIYIPKNRVDYVEELDLVYIELSNKSIAVASGCDYEKLLQQTKWSISEKGYPQYTKYPNKVTVKLQNYLLGDLPSGYVWDHINGNKLDNRRENLRIATNKQNNINRLGKDGTSIYKGVSFDKSRNKWISSIQVEGKTIHIGRFDDEMKCAEAYDDKAYELYGEFAKLNFPTRKLKPRMFVVYQKGYPQGIPCNKNTAEAWGMNEGDLFKCEPYLQIKMVNGSHAMWVPSINDILSEDWSIVK